MEAGPKTTQETIREFKDGTKEKTTVTSYNWNPIIKAAERLLLMTQPDAPTRFGFDLGGPGGTALTSRITVELPDNGRGDRTPPPGQEAGE